MLIKILISVWLLQWYRNVIWQRTVMANQIRATTLSWWIHGCITQIGQLRTYFIISWYLNNLCVFLTQCCFFVWTSGYLSPPYVHKVYKAFTVCKSCNTAWAITQQVERNTRCGRGELTVTAIKPRCLSYLHMINACKLHLNTNTVQREQTRDHLLFTHVWI